jgi:hypothetical protein
MAMQPPTFALLEAQCKERFKDGVANRRATDVWSFAIFLLRILAFCLCRYFRLDGRITSRGSV